MSKRKRVSEQGGRRAVAYLGGPWLPPERPNIFLTIHTVKRWDFKPTYFAQMCPQNAGNAVSET